MTNNDTHSRSTAAPMMNEHEIERLRRHAAERREEHVNWWRQRMVVELALYTGAKAAELAGLTCGDLRLVPGYETVRIRSASQPRVLPLTSDLASMLEDYLAWKREQGESLEADAPLVCSQRGGGLTLRGWQDAWALAQRHAWKRAGTDRPITSLESAREVVGRRIYALRSNPHDVQAWLGLAYSSNADRFRPADLGFHPVDLRDLLEPERPAPGAETSATATLLRAVSLFNGTSGVMNRYEARSLFLKMPPTDPLAQYWIARCLNLGRAFFPKNPDLAQEKASRWLPVITELADGGDLMALFLLASSYSEGLGTEIDEDRALDLYSEAARRGHETAMNNLGLMHQYGRGTAQDSERALDCFQQAAALHEGSAMFNVGIMYQEGVGTEPDIARAVHWFQKGASIGEHRSMHNLSYLYEHGIGVPQDTVAAERWYCFSGWMRFSPDGYVRPRSALSMIKKAG